MNKVISLFTVFSVTVSVVLSISHANVASASEIPKVQVISPQVAEHNEVLTLIGTVESKQNARLAQLQSGVVAEIFVEVGDEVSKGQRLLVLDAKLAELAVAQQEAAVLAASASLAEAKRLLAEINTLSSKQLVAETLMAERQAAVEILAAELSKENAQLDHLREQLSRHTLYAPFDGVIARRFVNLGEWVTQQTPAFNLVQVGELRLNVSIPQEYLLRLKSREGVSVEVMPDFEDATPMRAKLDRIVAVANNNNRTVTGLIYLPEDTQLMAGMSAQAMIALPADNQVKLWLPRGAIKQHPDGGNSVFTVEGGKVKRHLINIVSRSGDKVAVIGAPADMPIVISGVAVLKDGDAVTTQAVEGTR